MILYIYFVILVVIIVICCEILYLVLCIIGGHSYCFVYVVWRSQYSVYQHSNALLFCYDALQSL